MTSVTIAKGHGKGANAPSLQVRRTSRGEREQHLARIAVAAGIAFALSVGGALESDSTSRSLAVVTGLTGILVSPYDGAGASAKSVRTQS
jgi:hypothetical protein